MTMVTAPSKASPPASNLPASQPPRRRRGVNREGLEAGRRSTRIILWILLAAAMVLYGFPFLYLLFTSFKTPIDTIAVPPTILPKEWTLENYVNALGRGGVVASFINSIQTAVISTLLSWCWPFLRPTASRATKPRAAGYSSWPPW